MHECGKFASIKNVNQQSAEVNSADPLIISSAADQRNSN